MELIAAIRVSRLSAPAIGGSCRRKLPVMTPIFTPLKVEEVTRAAFTFDKGSAARASFPKSRRENGFGCMAFVILAALFPVNRVFCVLLSLIPLTTLAQTDWPVYGHDQGGTRFSPLTQIT